MLQRGCANPAMRWGEKVLGKEAHRLTIRPMRFPAQRKPVRAQASVPSRWRRDIQAVLLTDRQIARRIRTMARAIERDFRHRELVIVALLNGTVMFLADLIRHLSLPLRLDFVGVSSYRAGLESGRLVFTKELRLDVKDKKVKVQAHVKQQSEGGSPEGGTP